MYYVYVLKNKINSELYYGFTSNLEERLKQHYTNGEWQLLYYEAYLSEEDAGRREAKLKDYGQARAHLKKRINTSLNLK